MNEWEEWIAGWSTRCQTIFRALVTDERFDEAREKAVFYPTATPDVRLGWGTGARRTILAVIRCKGDSVMLRLTIPLQEALNEGGGLFSEPPSDPHANPNRADCYLKDEDIRPAVYEWLERARKFTQP